MAEKWETKGLDNNHFHSSRDERYEMGHIKKDNDKKSFLQRNPSFKIFLIDLVLIVIISGVIVPFLYKREGTSSLEGYGLNLRAFYFDDEVMISLTVEGDGENQSSDTLIEAHFHFEESAEEDRVIDILPAGSDERILKTNLMHNDQKYVLCTVSINGKNKTIKKKIR